MIVLRLTPLLIAVTLFLGAAPASAHRGHRKKSATRVVGGDAAARLDTSAITVDAGVDMARSGNTRDAGGGAAVAAPERAPATKQPATSKKAQAAGGELVELIGKLHPMLVHLPIGWLLLVLLVDVCTFVLKKHSWQTAGRLLLIGALLAMLPALGTGLLRHATHGPSDAEALIVLHRNVMLAMAAVLAAGLTLRLWRRERLGGAWKAVYLTLIVAGAALMVVGGHIGGKVVFGADYLPF